MEPVKKVMTLKNGMERPWYEYRSPLIVDKRVPLVFCLHGGGGDGYHAFECGNLKQVADKHPMIIISPLIEDVPRSFELSPESACVEIAKEFYDGICRAYQGMFHRIFVMGYSIGEFLTFQFCRRYAGLVDAFAGAVGPAPSETYCDLQGRHIFYPGQKAIPVFLWRGTKDYLYSVYTTGRKEESIQKRVIEEYKKYWKSWNRVENHKKEESDQFITETYGLHNNYMVHILAKDRGHSDEKDVFETAWKLLFSNYV